MTLVLKATCTAENGTLHVKEKAAVIVRKELCTHLKSSIGFSRNLIPQKGPWTQYSTAPYFVSYHKIGATNENTPIVYFIGATSSESSCVKHMA